MRTPRIAVGTAIVEVKVTYLRNEVIDEVEDQDSETIDVVCKVSGGVYVDHNYGADADGNRGIEVSYTEDLGITDEGYETIEDEVTEFIEENGYHLLSYEVIEIDSGSFDGYEEDDD